MRRDLRTTNDADYGARWLAFAAVFWTAVVVYGSLVPLRFHHVDWAEAVNRFRQIRFLHIGLGGRQDWVANGLLFLPIGFLGTAAIAWRRAIWVRMAAVPIVAVIGAATAVAVEFAQIYFPPRTVSVNDILAESIGVLTGCLLWAVAGSALTRWFRQMRHGRGQEFAEQLLLAYAVGLLAFSMLPCDFLISIEELRQKVDAGRVLWGLRTDVGLRHAVLGKLVLIAAHLPVGYLIARWSLTRRASTAWMLGVGVMYSAAGELMQLVVYSRIASAVDVGIALTGIVAGGMCGRWTVRDLVARAPRLGSFVWSAAVGTYVLLVSIMYLFPLRWTTDPAMVAKSWAGFFRPPGAAHYVGTEFAALSNILVRVITFGGFGALAWLASRPRTARSSRAIWLQMLMVVALLWGLAIEVPQIWLVDRVADVTDVVIGAVGAIVGAVCARGFYERVWERGT